MAMRIVRGGKARTAIAGWRAGRHRAPVKGVAVGEAAAFGRECCLLITAKKQVIDGISVLKLSCKANLVRTVIRPGSVTTLRIPRRLPKGLPDRNLRNRHPTGGGNSVDIGASDRIKDARYILYGFLST
jgi:hypothetical protein